MSVTKLLSRIAAPSHLEGTPKLNDKGLHDHTYGITSDPLTHFACAFSALIHDVDHYGVSNAQLVKEGDALAKKYKDRSVAEQNSLDLSWNLLMKPEYEDLREFLFPSTEERRRFRQLVVNVRSNWSANFTCRCKTNYQSNLYIFVLFYSAPSSVGDEYRYR